ncbi:MAG: hydroxyacid dehydrogenase [Rhizobiales bacterium]|nr:hydroxyacid dehydrogenase [Hyphomicrobiales bacterium]
MSSSDISALHPRFISIVGERNAITDPGDIAPFLVEQRGLYKGESGLVLRPGNVEEVSQILKLASETGTPVVPQGGNTGLTGAQVPAEGAIVISMARMNKVRDIDTAGGTMIVEAGVVLQKVQEAADEAGLLFPLSLGAEGSCQIGGNLSTNAGGTAVLAYGNTRQLCLGLEVVLPTGEIWNGLRRLKKDNTGYDLRDLFIGAEGTLGIITAAVLKLSPKPKGRQTVLVGIDDPATALKLFRMAEDACGTALTGFELMPRIAIEFVVRHNEALRDPLSGEHPWYVLFEISSGQSEDAARELMESLFVTAYEDGLIRDAVASESEAQRTELWLIRESISDSQKPEGGSIKHDVSVPVSRVPDFLNAADAAVHARMPDARIVAFGHLGDGNIHYNISQPVGADKDEYLSHWHEMNEIVHGIVLDMGGSISAEHGIGQLKRDELASIREPIEIELMRRIKRSFDPAGIMNPNKVVSV